MSGPVIKVMVVAKLQRQVLSGVEHVDGTAAHGRDVLTTTAPTLGDQREAAGTLSQPLASQQTVAKILQAPTMEQTSAIGNCQVIMWSKFAKRFSWAATNFSPPEELPESSPGRSGQTSGQAMWLVKLGEFVQKRITQAGAVVPPAAGLSPPASWSGQPTTSSRLSLPAAERQMQQWMQSAPLLHGPPPQPQPESGSSSRSVTQEQILSEVQRRVRQAMSEFARRQNLLLSENDQLREMVGKLLQTQGAGNSEGPLFGTSSGPQGGVRGFLGPELARIPEDPGRDPGWLRGNPADPQPVSEEPVLDLTVQRGSLGVPGDAGHLERPCEGQLRLRWITRVFRDMSKGTDWSQRLMQTLGQKELVLYLDYNLEWMQEELQRLQRPRWAKHGELMLQWPRQATQVELPQLRRIQCLVRLLLQPRGQRLPTTHAFGATAAPAWTSSEWSHSIESVGYSGPRYDTATAGLSWKARGRLEGVCRVASYAGGWP